MITPKEQYEAWIYLDEFLRLTHGAIDPTVEKLVAEFLQYTLDTLSYTLPPVGPAAAMTQSPAAYPTVMRNRLDLHIPLEDMRDGWGTWGAIGQEVYGAGMAPTLAALAYREVSPGVTLYSGYPVVEIEGGQVTLAGAPSYITPIQLFGAAPSALIAEPCGAALCAEVEGGATLIVDAAPRR